MVVVVVVHVSALATNSCFLSEVVNLYTCTQIALGGGGGGGYSSNAQVVLMIDKRLVTIRKQ